MWNWDRENDLYRHSVHTDYYVTCDMPPSDFLYKTFRLHNNDSFWKLISTDLYSALDEAELVIEELLARERPSV